MVLNSSKRQFMTPNMMVVDEKEVIDSMFDCTLALTEGGKAKNIFAEECI